MNNELLDEIKEDDFEQLSDSDIFKLLWSQPKKVARFLAAEKYDKYVPFLLTVPPLLAVFTSQYFRPFFSFSNLLIPCVATVLSSWIFSYLYAILVRWVGSFFSGEANYYAILIVILYAGIPSTLKNILEPIYMYNMPELVFVFKIVGLGISIYTLVLTVAMVAEVHKFNNGLAFVSLLLGGLIFLVPFLIIGFSGLMSYIM